MPSRQSRMSTLLMALVMAVLMATACAGTDKSDSRPLVVAGAYPLGWIAEQVGGDAVRVDLLVKPGVEPHDVEFTPRQVTQVKAADVVVLIKGFQPAVDDALGEGRVVDLAGLQDTGSDDPHVWLDPLRLLSAVEQVRDGLVEADPAHADGYRARADRALAQLRELDGVFRTALAQCDRSEVVTSHDAFGYLAARYRLEQVPLSGFSPDADPSPGRIAQVARFAKENGVTTIFFEQLVNPAVAETVAKEIGATTAVLDPVESVAEGDTYLSVMRRNAAALRSALGCT